MRWLFRVFFLERFSLLWAGWSSRFSWIARRPTTSPREQIEFLYKTELDYLATLLREQLQEPVFYKIDVTGRAIVGTVSETIAEITLYPKGKRKRSIYMVIRLEDNFAMYKAWFQLASLGFRVRFRPPVLTLHKSWSLPSRGR
jgi:hypothetical protein